MKRFFSVLIISALCLHLVYSQTTPVTGKPITEIFSDFHYTFKDTTKTTGFGINRAYLGYNYLPGGNFSAKVIVNIGTPEDLPEGAKQKRYAYFREASITYTGNNLTISFGIAGTRIFDFQQKFWGKRYIATEYQALYGYGSVADLGVVIDYKINDILKVDMAVFNGKGYSNIQYDNSLKTTAGITITAPNHFALRLYGDIMKTMNVLQVTTIAFAGFKNELISFGAEASYKTNLNLIEGHDAWGLAGTGAIAVANKTEVFARYDYAASVMAKGDIAPWNYLKDGSIVIYGIQYTFNENLRIALNYQGTVPYLTSRQGTDAIYLNAHFKF